MAKVLIYDIETAPIVGTAWSKYETDLVWVVEDWYMIGFSCKYLGKKQCFTYTLPDFKTYKKEPKNDIELVKKLYEYFDKSDILIAHNGDRFDRRKTNARILKHDLAPPEPYQTIDTLKVARKHFALTSYKLDDLASYLGLGHKLKTDKSLWQGCMAGDMKAWRAMKRYNRQDVLLLEDVYMKLRPWIDNHPSIALLDDKPVKCPKCGSGPLHAAGFRMTKVGKYRRFRCTNCGGWSMSRHTVKTEVQLTN